jgi:hypothetical protein
MLVVLFLGVIDSKSRAGYVKLANRRAGYLSSLPLIRTSCSTGFLLCEAGRLPPSKDNTNGYADRD